MPELSFEEQIAAGMRVEASDEMPDEYRQEAARMMEFHAASEVMGPVQEFRWVPKAPSLYAKKIFAAKSQDEVGHGQMLLRVCEDLTGKSRREYMEQFLYGPPRFMNAFHYRWDRWADPVIVCWLVDGAEIERQGTLLKSSYGPYARAMKKIVSEEGFHFHCGYALARSMLEGTAAQRRELQQALERWWPRVLAQFGPPDEQSRHGATLMKWRLKLKSNEDLRQSWLTRFVPMIQKHGLEIPDNALRFDEEMGRWSYTEPDWQEFRSLLRGGSPVGDDVQREMRAAREKNGWAIATLWGARVA